MIRILLFPNISNSSKRNNLHKVSYLQFLENLIEMMYKKRKDIFWYIVIPKEIDENKGKKGNLKSKLNFPNTHFIELNIPASPLSKIHFDTNELNEKIKWREFPIDLVFCHKPEITRQIRLFFKSSTNLNPPILGYLHLFELPEINWEGVFEYIIFGVTEMDVCFLNTPLQKQMVHDQARKIFSTSICGELHEKIHVFPQVTVPRNIRPGRSGRYEKIIVWNHFVDDKVNFLDFEKTILTLRRERNDFKVYIPLMNENHRLSTEYRWVETDDNTNKKKHLEKLRKCCVGVSPKNLYGEWRKATIEGNSCGIPYIMYNELYYKDINKDADFFNTRKQLLTLLNNYLDDSKYRNEMAGKAIENLIMRHNMKSKLNTLNSMINVIQRKKRPIRSKKTNEMIKLIKERKVITHKALFKHKKVEWKIGEKIDGYRKSILNTKGIEEIDIRDNKNQAFRKKYEWKSIYRYSKK